MFPFDPQHDFLVGIDSDGCAFDTMELKHKECFIPNTINYYELQGVSKYAREAAEFVNLYSKSRGINRFPALIETLEWLQKRPDVACPGDSDPRAAGPVAWIGRETKLGNPALAKAVEAERRGGRRRRLAQALDWSVAVNKAIEGMVRGVPPFPCVRESLQRLSPAADVLVVSATPQEALTREWQEHKLDGHVRAICGQESGTKKQFMALSAKYPKDHAADDRRRPRRLCGGQGQRGPVLSRSTPARKKPVGGGSTTKRSTASLAARSPASIKRNSWPNSIARCPPSRPGRSTTGRDSSHNRKGAIQ